MSRYPTKCKECGAVLVLAPSGLVCPNGHGRIIPIPKDARPMCAPPRLRRKKPEPPKPAA